MVAGQGWAHFPGPTAAAWSPWSAAALDPAGSARCPWGYPAGHSAHLSIGGTGDRWGQVMRACSSVPSSISPTQPGPDTHISFGGGNEVEVCLFLTTVIADGESQLIEVLGKQSADTFSSERGRQEGAPAPQHSPCSASQSPSPGHGGSPSPSGVP